MGVSVPSPACKHFQKQDEPRPVAVEEGSCSVRRSLQHRLQLPVTWKGMQIKLMLVSFAGDSSLTVMRVAALEFAEPFWDGHNAAGCFQKGLGRVKRGVHTATPL